jgi:sugar phosphate isomerase/epimerase
LNKIGLGTTSVFPMKIEDCFSIAKDAGYDGIELMITSDRLSRDINHLKMLQDKYALPIMSLHAPVLLLTHFVWGTDPEIKLQKTAQFASDLGSETVVVHPPFAWQGAYSENFLDIVDKISNRTGIVIAVENMFPWKYKNREIKAYKPTWETITRQTPNITLDFSHAALSGLDSFEIARSLGNKLHHIHLCDGFGINNYGEKDPVFDEHLPPGKGSQPIAETLEYLAKQGWGGKIVAEINTRKQRTRTEKVDILAESAYFARDAIRKGLQS